MLFVALLLLLMLLFVILGDADAALAPLTKRAIVGHSLRHSEQQPRKTGDGETMQRRGATAVTAGSANSL